ncbi:unnamed protein product [Pedinophyceae sp. YPF-701]|nr:unnamed protein product [Pedinophyceae sp. YPF-701]
MDPFGQPGTSDLGPTRNGGAAVRTDAADATTGDNIEGTIVREKYMAGGYAVVVVRLSRGEIVCRARGTAAAGLAVGTRVRMWGEHFEHDQYGGQFEVKRWEELPFESGSDLRRFLINAVPGCGPKTAERILAHFGDAQLAEAALDLPEKEAERKLRGVPGLGQKLAARLKRGWDKARGGSQRQALELGRRLRDLGAGPVDRAGVLDPLVARHGSAEGALAALENSPDGPYRELAGCVALGAGLGDLDRVAAAVGGTAGDPERVTAAVAAALYKAGLEGRPCLTLGEAGAAAAEILRRPWPGAGGGAEGGVLWGVPAQRLTAVECPLAWGAAAGVRSETSLLALVHRGSLREVAPGDLPAPIAGEGADGSRVVINPGARGANEYVVYLRGVLDAESAVVRGMVARAGRNAPPVRPQRTVDVAAHIRSFESRQGVTLTDGQRRAVELAAHSRVLAITGGPGTGKTFVTRCIVELWDAQGRDFNLCAPTGRAAQRLSEVTGKPAETVHRLLRLGAIPVDAQTDPNAAQEGGGASGGADAAEAGSHAESASGDSLLAMLQQTASHAELVGTGGVLVDESSMLHSQLAAVLLRALDAAAGGAPPVPLVLVGDPDQLPPVLPHPVLSALLAADSVPQVRLDEVKRRDGWSAITSAAARVNEGALPCAETAGAHVVRWDAGGSVADIDAALVSALQEGGESEARQEFVWVQPPADVDAGATRDAVVAAVRALTGPGGSFLPDDVMVLSPMRRGPLGAGVLNGALQPHLRLDSGPNGHSPSRQNTPPGCSALPEVVARTRGEPGAWRALRTGDRVMQLRNRAEQNVYNGDIGVVTACWQETAAEWDASRRVLRGARVRFSRNQEIEYSSQPSSRQLPISELDVAWASTVHKAQGGESGAVVVVLSPVHGVMLHRKLLYTAVSRAKRVLVLVACEGSVATAVTAATQAGAGASAGGAVDLLRRRVQDAMGAGEE